MQGQANEGLLQLEELNTKNELYYDTTPLATFYAKAIAAPYEMSQ